MGEFRQLVNGLVSLSTSLPDLGWVRVLLLGAGLFTGAALPAAAQPGSESGSLIVAQMGGMRGGSQPKPFYPGLIEMPTLSAEARGQIEQQAHAWIDAGNEALTRAQSDYHSAMIGNNAAAMDQAASRMRDGLSQLESGTAALQALAEGKAPRNLALGWFKREMNLASPEDPRALLGVTPFHLFTMGLLIAFALAMVAMYFFKMRRATALFGRIKPAPGAPPPPGASPPLAGAPGPAAPAAPPPGGSSAAPVPSGGTANGR